MTTLVAIVLLLCLLRVISKFKQLINIHEFSFLQELQQLAKENPNIHLLQIG